MIIAYIIGISLLIGVAAIIIYVLQALILAMIEAVSSITLSCLESLAIIIPVLTVVISGLIGIWFLIKNAFS